MTNRAKACYTDVREKLNSTLETLFYAQQSHPQHADAEMRIKMSDTIFFHLQLKRTRTPQEVFTKMTKKIKKKGPTKNWTYDIQGDCLLVDFHDDSSETFCVDFQNKIADGFCKVKFQLGGEGYDDSQSEFVALMEMIYAARTSFSHMEISDDFGLASAYLEGKRFKIKLRELTEEEMDRAKQLYQMGYIKYTDFIMAVCYMDLEIPFGERYQRHVNTNLSFVRDHLNRGSREPFFATYLYELAEYQDQGRTCEIPDFDGDPCGILFSRWAFTEGVEFLFYIDLNWNPMAGEKYAQVRRLYVEKILPILEEGEDSFDKCVLSYQYFVSIFEYCGFKRVEKMHFSEECYDRTL